MVEREAEEIEENEYIGHANDHAVESVVQLPVAELMGHYAQDLVLNALLEESVE